MRGPVIRAVEERVRGERPSRVRSLTAAVVVAAAAGVITYRVLRRPGEESA